MTKPAVLNRTLECGAEHYQDGERNDRGQMTHLRTPPTSNDIVPANARQTRTKAPAVVFSRLKPEGAVNLVRRIFAGVILTVVATASPATAFESGNPAADAFIAMFTPKDSEVSVSQDGNNLLVEMLPIPGADSTDTTEKAVFESMTIFDPSKDNSTYTAEKIQINGIRAPLFNRTDVHTSLIAMLSVKLITMENVRVTPDRLTASARVADTPLGLFTSFRIEEVRVASDDEFNLEVPEIVWNQDYNSETGNWHMSMSADDATLTLQPTASVSPQLIEILPSPIVMDLSWRGSFTTRNAEFVMDNFVLSLGELIEISTSFSVADVPDGIYQAANSVTGTEDGKLDAMVASVAVGAVALTITDAGLVDRALHVFAQQQGLMPDELRLGLVRYFEAVLKQGVQDHAFAESALDGVTSLLNGGSVTVTAAPNSPLPLTQLIGLGMISPDPAIEALNLQITPE